MFLDLLYILITIVLVFLGYKKGFIKGAIGLMNILISIYAVPKVLDILPESMISGLTKGATKYLLYSIVFVIMWIVLSIVGYMISSIIESVGILGYFNKFLGLILGLIKSSLLVFIIFMSFLIASDHIQGAKKALEESRISDKISIYLMPYNYLFPEYIKDKLEHYRNEVRFKEFKNRLINDIERGA